MINVRTYLLSIPYNAFHENRSVAGRHLFERVHVQYSIILTIKNEPVDRREEVICSLSSHPQ